MTAEELINTLKQFDMESRIYITDDDKCPYLVIVNDLDEENFIKMKRL